MLCEYIVVNKTDFDYIRESCSRKCEFQAREKIYLYYTIYSSKTSGLFWRASLACKPTRLKSLVCKHGTRWTNLAKFLPLVRARIVSGHLTESRRFCAKCSAKCSAKCKFQFFSKSPLKMRYWEKIC